MTIPYLERKARMLCASCSRPRQHVKPVHCGDCLERVRARREADKRPAGVPSTYALRNIGSMYESGHERRESDDLGSREMSTHTHAIERACAGAYRVERWSVPRQAWEVVIYAFPLARAVDHARRLREGYLQANAAHYGRVRVTDKNGVEK